MAEGRTRRSAKDLQGALESFRAADSLLHFPTTGLEVARAEADLGLLLQARETLKRFLDIAAPPNDLPQFKKARALGAGLLVEIERTIKAEVDLEARESKEIGLALPAQPAPPSAATAPTTPVPAAELAPRVGPSGATTTPPTKTDRTLAFVGFGVACAGVTVSVIAGLSSISHTRSAEDGCSGGRCPPSTHDDLQTAHTFATVSNISLIVAGVGIGTGIIGLLQKPPTTRAAPNAALTPWLGLGAAGVNGTF
jgi:hypothetical protein